MGLTSQFWLDLGLFHEIEAKPDTKAKNLWLKRYRAQSGKSTTTILLNAYSNENDS